MPNSERKPNRWYVITGGPCCGKTTTVNLLRSMGYETTVEEARHYIDLQRADGKTPEEIERNQADFQKHVLDLQIAQERSLSPDTVVFLDRAIPDARAYYQFLGIPEDRRLASVLESVSYHKIFILDLLPLVNDYARRDNVDAQRSIHALLIEVYRSLGFPVIQVPVLPAEKRVEFILDRL
ncbi:MAG: ATP-binding protein [Acidobacteria bacterium]|nr:ATP-binding protein [Acidobacteriota bacterium]